MKTFRDMLKRRGTIRESVEDQDDQGFVIPSKPSRDDIWDFCEYVTEYLGEKEFLDSLTRALSTYELLDNLKYIADAHGIPFSEEDEDD